MLDKPGRYATLNCWINHWIKKTSSTSRQGNPTTHTTAAYGSAPASNSRLTLSLLHKLKSYLPKSGHGFLKFQHHFRSTWNLLASLAAHFLVHKLRTSTVLHLALVQKRRLGVPHSFLLSDTICKVDLQKYARPSMCQGWLRGIIIPFFLLSVELQHTCM